MKNQIIKGIRTLFQRNYFDNYDDFLIELLLRQEAELIYKLNNDMCEMRISSLKDEKHFTEFSLPKFLVENISDMKYFIYRQNENDGHIVTNENVAKFVIIEASNVTEAEQKASQVGIYFDGVEKRIDCGCGCGDRWYRVEEDDLDKVIEFPYVDFNPNRKYFHDGDCYLCSNIDDFIEYLFDDYEKTETPIAYLYKKDNQKIRI